MHAPLAVTTHDLAQDPAARAWAALGGEPPASVSLLRTASRSKPALHRLAFDPPGAPAVFAKRTDGDMLDLERRIYETILPLLPVTVAPYRGACVDDEGFTWMFVEDVGEQCLSPADPRHRALAGRWLGLLHRSSEDVVAGIPLPDAGAGRYLAHLRAGREEIRNCSGNRALSAEDRAVLSTVLSVGEALEARWGELERACAGFPVTLVHADFQPKNLRIRMTDAGPVLCPIDWETAGRGVPAADLARASSPGLTMLADPAAYETMVHERWTRMDSAAVRRLSVLGHLFQPFAGIHWASADLRFEDPRCLIRPVTSMRRYLTQIASALEAGKGWLA